MRFTAILLFLLPALSNPSCGSRTTSAEDPAPEGEKKSEEAEANPDEKSGTSEEEKSQASDHAVAGTATTEDPASPGGTGNLNPKTEAVKTEALPQSGSQSVQGAVCGSVLGEIDGIQVFSNGNHTGTGTSCAGATGEHGNRYQCVELMNRYYMTLYDAPLISCDARDCLKKFSAQAKHFYTYANGKMPKPRRGDTIVFDGGSYGHVGLVTHVAGERVAFINQNSATLMGIVTYKLGKMGSWGQLRATGLIRHRQSRLTVSRPSAQPPAAIDPG